MTDKRLLGDLLIDKGLVSKEVIEQALKAQVGGNRRLGVILVKMKVITEDQLVETLASQLNIETYDLSERFSPDVRRLVPRYLCNTYGVLPLQKKPNNVLELAMANPTDEEAINNLENYTGMAVEPTLAKHSEIDKMITKNIPYGLKDFFSPRSNVRITRMAVALCFLLIAGVATYTYQYMHAATYGTKSVTENSTIYKNHDLMVGFEKNGKVSLLGRGAYAKGYYSVSFNDPSLLQTFISGREKDFSEKQREWLDWAISTGQLKFQNNALALKN